MRLCLLWLLLLATSLPAAAQRQLSNSIQHSAYKYIYKIDKKEAIALALGKPGKLNEGYLHSLVDSFPIRGAEPVLKPGNYIIVFASANQLIFEQRTVGDFQIKLINNDHDLYVAAHTKNGELIHDATLYSGNKRLRFNPKMNAYGPVKSKKTKFINAEYKNVFFSWPTAFRNYRKPVKLFHRPNYYRNYFNGPTPSEDHYKGFIVFNKPKYKPGDTVRLKAFVENNNGKPVKTDLLLRISDRDLVTDTILATLHPYKPGAFVYEFVLTDSLDLDLDEDYLVTLETLKSKKYNLDDYEGDLDDDEYALKRQVLTRGKFTYEDYELGQITFNARSSKKEHARNEELALFAKAADENDLPVMDGRVQITVLSDEHGYKAFHTTKLFLPDTLWTHEQALETLGETKIVLPDSIFPKANFSYQVVCNFLNSNNEYQSRILYQTFRDETGSIDFELKNDSLLVSHTVAGKPAILSVLGQKNDTLEQRFIRLPATVKLNPFATSYHVFTDSLEKIYDLKEGKAVVSCLSSRTKDSIAIQLVNPSHLQVWYSIFAGHKIIARGIADSLFFEAKTRTSKNYFVSLQYIYNNQLQKENYTIPFKDKQLSINVTQPGSIYPGQTVSIDVNVTDATGKPVANADLTAYSYTSKFKAQDPYIPYLGKLYPGRKINRALYFKDQSFGLTQAKLNWQRWSKEMSLDTIEYYRFLHPHGRYINTEAAPDSVTQIAPFVVSQGDLQPVQLLYIDEKLVFFNQSEQLQRYSFRVREGKHSLRIRTQDKEIRLDSVWAAKGMKTFLSIEADSANWQKMPDTLSSYEQSLLNKYMILIENNFGEHFAYIRQDQNYYLLNANNQRSGNILAGPLTNGYANLIVKRKFSQDFIAEGQWQYSITEGLIKQKQYNDRKLFRSWLPGSAQYNFHDFVLTEDEINELWQDYLDNRSANRELFRNTPFGKTGNGRLQIDFAAQNKIFTRNIILFRYDDPDFMRIYPGSTKSFGSLQPGKYRILLLLKKDAYFIKDSVNVIKDGLNFYRIDNIEEKAKDSVSIQISKVIESRDLYNVYVPAQDLLEIKESFNSKYLDASSFINEISGIVTDEKGAPLPGVSIMIKGTRIGVTTNDRGEFSLKVPDNGVITIASVGFSSQELMIRPGGSYNVRLYEAENRLQEVVVVGYEQRRKRELVGSVTTVSGDDLLAGKSAGILIRGNNSTESLPPLIFVDGLPYNGKLEDLDIATTTVLKSSEATALYGARAAGGVIVITTKKAKFTEQALPGNILRQNFRDYAYWMPKLTTDKNGKASFTTTFPDDITNWQTFVIAMGNKKQSGFAESSIRSFKSLSGNIALPQFAIAGDSINIIGKTLNYLQDSIKVKRSFFVNDVVIKEQMLHLKNSWIDTFNVVAAAKDSLKLKYTVTQSNGFFDGEERSIPVFQPGVLETTGYFKSLDKDTSFQLQFGKNTGTINIYAETTLLPVLSQETERIREYEYLCNEQLASKLKSQLIQKKIDEYLHQPFKGDRNIRELISKLNQNKAADGLWGWWSNTTTSAWISLHVIEALLQAKEAGYTVSINNTLLKDFLVYNLESYQSTEKIASVFLLRQLGVNADYKRYIDSLEKNRNNNLYEKLRITELRQLNSLPINIDSLLNKAQRTVFGNLYWGEDNYQFFNNAIQNTLCMYRILQMQGGHETELKKIRNYFLEKRGSGHWRNTYESSLIMEAILPGLLAEQANSNPLSLTLQTKEPIVVTKFPFQTTLANAESVKVSKTGTAPVYFTAYQQHWNSDPQKVDGNFKISSTFEKNGKTIASLKAGEPVQLKVHVSVVANAEYVMVEIPIPAGCSYQQKNQSWLNGEVHREHFKNKVSLFCNFLGKGEYDFSVSLLPRYTGVYTLNPAKAEMMYFPVFYGREAIRKIKIN